MSTKKCMELSDKVREKFLLLGRVAKEIKTEEDFPFNIVNHCYCEHHNGKTVISLTEVTFGPEEVIFCSDDKHQGWVVSLGNIYSGRRKLILSPGKLFFSEIEERKEKGFDKGGGWIPTKNLQISLTTDGIKEISDTGKYRFSEEEIISYLESILNRIIR